MNGASMVLMWLGGYLVGFGVGRICGRRYILDLLREMFPTRPEEEK